MCYQRHQRRFHWLRAVACALTGVAVAHAAPVNIVAIDGTKTQGEWIGINNGKVVVQVGANPVAFDVDDLMVLDFAGSSSAGKSGRMAAEHPLADALSAVYLADGGRIAGELLRAEGERVALRTKLTGELSLPFEQLAGVRIASPEAFPISRELFDEALGARLPGQDVMVTRGLDDVKALRGRLAQLGPDGGSFVFADKERSFQPHRLFGVVFAAGVAKGEPLPLFVALSDGTSFSAEPLQADAKDMKLRMVGGTEINIPLGQLSRIDIRSRRLVHVSDLTPKSENTEGRLHRPTPLRRDRSIIGGMMSLGDVRYPKGLAMTSRTTVTYDLGGAYAAFAATVGIDDAVRPYGAVNLLVIGDGKSLFDSGTITGLDEPRDITVRLDGVKELTLVTDYGDGVDLSDHVDWALARLLKKAKTAEGSPTVKPKDGD